MITYYKVEVNNVFSMFTFFNWCGIMFANSKGMIMKEIIEVMPNPDAKRFPVVDQCLSAEVEVEEIKFNKPVMMKITRPECNKVLDGLCVAYESPSKQWRLGCPLASNKLIKTEKGKFVNPLKASKQASGYTKSARKRKNR
jgi:hypothetical protein